jgi:hypothetical protein
MGSEEYGDLSRVKATQLGRAGRSVIFLEKHPLPQWIASGTIESIA